MGFFKKRKQVNIQRPDSTNEETVQQDALAVNSDVRPASVLAFSLENEADLPDQADEATDSMISAEAEAEDDAEPAPSTTAQASINLTGQVDYSKEENLLALIEAMVKPVPEGQAFTVFPDPKNDLFSNEPESSDGGGGGGQPDQLAPHPNDRNLQKLRELILGREIEGLDKIHRYLSDNHGQAEAVSRVITEALLLRINRDNKLDTVLQPTVENIMRASVRRNPAELAENLFPVIGPAIRRSIAESFKGMLQDVSHTLEVSLSLKGLKWRLEGWRTGRKFSEVVLLKNLEYLVEEIYFVHTETGAILDHLIRAGSSGQDAAQVAAMFTAIQQFVNDSFSEGQLSNIEFGDVDILLARSPRAYLACVVRGQPPGHLRSDLQAALELMVMECADDLDSFIGDTFPFLKARRHMEGLLTSRLKEDGHNIPFWAKLLPLFFVLTILGGLGFLGYKYYQMTVLAETVNEAILRPGIVPVRVAPSLFGQWNIICFKDELAAAPDDRVIAAGLPQERYSIRYLPYISQDYAIIEKRLEMLLADKPEGLTVKLSSDGQTASLTGDAPVNWVLTAYERLRAVPGLQKIEIPRLTDSETGIAYWFDSANVLHLEGQASAGWREAITEKIANNPSVSGININHLSEDPATVELMALRDKINSISIHFGLNSDQPIPADEQQLRQTVDDLVIMEKLAESMNLDVSLTIYGHADATGSARRNYELSQERTKVLAAMLYAKGSNIPISIYGMGADFAEPDENVTDGSNQASRKIELRVGISRKPITLTLDQLDSLDE